jgi:hypothetical protein
VEPIAKNQSDLDIETILEQYHNNTEEINHPYHKWISFKDHLPLDKDELILVRDHKFNGVYTNRSFVTLQHYLWSKYKGYSNQPTHWMRIKLPED